MFWVWLGLGVSLGIAFLIGLGLLLLFAHLRHRYLGNIVRCFEEKPFFIIPRGQPISGAEDITFQSRDGIKLHGCYLATQSTRRLGVILFGLEFGSNCWSCLPYCQHLLNDGFDIFTFESRNQGNSEAQPGYEPLQWVTNLEVMDTQAAISYLKNRSDADPRGIGLFGISKGGSAGLQAAAREPYVRCFVTDGVFATFTTLVPYMRKWISIYSDRYLLQLLLPKWMYGWVGYAALRHIGRARHCRFPYLEKAMRRLAPRPWLMIHGAADTYIKPEMAKSLFDRAGPPKELWLVEGAKHNLALHVAGDEYRRRVLQFFQTHLAELTPSQEIVALAKTD